MAIQDEKTEKTPGFPDEGFVRLSQLILPLRAAIFMPGRFDEYTHTRLLPYLWLFLPPFVYFQAYPYTITGYKYSTIDISLIMSLVFYQVLIGLAMILLVAPKPWSEEVKSKNIQRGAFNLAVSSFCIPASLIYGVGLLDIQESCRTLIRIILLAYAVPMAAHAYSRVPWFDPSKSWRNWLKAALLMAILLFPVLKKMLHG